MPILTVENLVKSFGKTEVLKGVSFSLEKGQVLSIIGSSGSGKTTLLRCLNSLEFANSGTVTVGGSVIFNGAQKSISEQELRQRRLHFGLVFQSFNLFPQYTALQNVMLAPNLLKKASPEENCQRATELLERVGLKDRMENYPCQLSGGQQRRVSLARAMLADSAAVLLDEPFKGLDEETKACVLAFVRRAVEGRTAVLVTHDAAEARALGAAQILTL